MRVIWNVLCDPTLHVIAIALLLAAMGSALGLDGSRLEESSPPKRCRFCLFYHDADPQCAHPRLIVASQGPTD